MDVLTVVSQGILLHPKPIYTIIKTLLLPMVETSHDETKLRYLLVSHILQ